MSADQRPTVPGFGALFVFSLAKALAEAPPLNDAELLLSAIDAPEAPTTCPLCGCPALAPSRGPEGWTWLCFEGCNP